MGKCFIVFIGSLYFLGCGNVRESRSYAAVDTISATQFFSNHNSCDIAMARNFSEIKPQMVPWATDPKDPYSDSYFIDNKKLTIRQPLKRSDLPDSNRRYYFDGRDVKTTRVVVDSLGFDFNRITVDYGDAPHDIFRSGRLILLRNEPANFTGTANRFRFVQLFDLDKMVCYEFFVDYYACLTGH